MLDMGSGEKAVKGTGPNFFAMHMPLHMTRISCFHMLLNPGFQSSH